MIFINWILHLYPRTWRERYESETIASLGQRKITLFTILDMLLGALKARLEAPHSGTPGRPILARKLDLAAIIFVSVFPIFLLANFLWATRVADPSGVLYPIFNNSANPIANFSSLIMLGCIVLIWLASCVSGLLITVTTIRYALSTHHTMLLISTILLGLLILLFPLQIVLMLTLHSPFLFFLLFSLLRALGFSYPIGFIAYMILVFLGPIASSLVALLAFTRGNLGRRTVRFLLVPATIATLAMMAMLSTNVIWAITTWNDIFQMYDPIVIPFSILVKWLIGWASNFVLMALPALTTFFILIRGLASLRTPPIPNPSPIQHMPLQKQQ